MEKYNDKKKINPNDDFFNKSIYEKLKKQIKYNYNIIMDLLKKHPKKLN